MCHHLNTWFLIDLTEADAEVDAQFFLLYLRHYLRNRLVNYTGLITTLIVSC